MDQNVRRWVIVANGVALLALVVALSGGVYAAAKINGKNIKKASIAGKKLKPDGVTGKQVRESTLGTVPSARTLNGVGAEAFAAAADTKRIRFEQNVTSGFSTQEVLSIGSLRLTLKCAASGYFEIEIASTASAAAFDYSSVYEDESTAPAAFVTGGLVDSSPQNFTASTNISPGGYDREVGTMVYNSNNAGETISVYLAGFAARSGSATYCNLAGTAVRVAD